MMKGWKTWTGGALLGLAGAAKAVIEAGADLAPIVAPALPAVNIPAWAPWVLIGVGGAMTAWGIGHKIEKLNE